MIKNNGQDKQLYYQKKIAPFQANIKELLKKEGVILAECRADPVTAAPKLFFLAERMLDIMSNYLMLNGIAQTTLGAKDETALSEARRSVSKAIIYLENIVTGKVDAPFSEYEAGLTELDSINLEQRYNIARKLGLSVSLLKAAYGNNSKWRWVFVDMDGHCAAVVKNLLDLKKAQANNDPASPDYETLLYHVRFVKKMLNDAAERLHSRYMLATKRNEDIRQAGNFLSALQRIYIIFNENDEADMTKRKYDRWISTLEADMKKAAEQK
ncbi:MAG: hypothetical protein LBH50_04265 [Spirochaetaceae bacterium]|jgi:hypothetical protein|nr:hypothetical protein [Spirochaetaceae bacterium]